MTRPRAEPAPGRLPTRRGSAPARGPTGRSGSRARIAFFGPPGPLATRPLAALVASGLSPRLVLEGDERAHETRGDGSRLVRAEPTLVDRVGAWLAETLAGPPEDLEVERDLAGLSHRLGIDAVRRARVNGTRVAHWLRALRPDAYVVIGLDDALSPDLLALAPRGGLRLHLGRLPEERGADPLFWALKAGRAELGWTLHVLDASGDGGDVVGLGQIQVHPGATAERIAEALAVAATPALIRGLRALIEGDLVRSPQPTPSTPRAPRPRFRDGRIDQSRSAQAVYAFVRACATRRSLFFESAGDRFFIQDAERFEPERSIPGEFLLTGDRLLLRCHPGVVTLRVRPGGAIFRGEY